MTEIPFYIKTQEVTHQTILTVPYQIVKAIRVTVNSTEYSTSSGTTFDLDDLELQTGLRVASFTPEKYTIIYISGETSVVGNLIVSVTVSDGVTGSSDKTYSVTGTAYSGTKFVLRYFDAKGEYIEDDAYFVENRDARIASMALKAGYSGTVPEGKQFVSWGYPSSSIDVEADEIIELTPVFKDADAVSKEYKLTFKYQSGSENVEYSSKTQNTTLGYAVFSWEQAPTTSEILEKESVEFRALHENEEITGWKLASSSSADISKSNSLTITEDAVVFAVWEFTGAKYVFQFTESDVPSYTAYTHSLSEKIYVPLTTPTKGGYVFKGWKVGENVLPLTATSYEYTSSQSNDVITFTAQWNPTHTVTVRYILDGDEVPGYSTKYTGEAGDKFTHTVKAGKTTSEHEFSHWLYNSKKYIEDNTIPVEIGDVDSYIDLTAVLLPLYKYSVKYIYNDGVHQDKEVAEYSSASEHIMFFESDPGYTKVGATLVGWKTLGDTPIKYAFGTQITLESDKPSITVEGDWDKSTWYSYPTGVDDEGVLYIEVGAPYEVLAYDIPYMTSDGLVLQTTEFARPYGINSISSKMVGESRVGIYIKGNIPTGVTLPEDQYFITYATYSNGTTTETYHFYSKVEYLDTYINYSVTYIWGDTAKSKYTVTKETKYRNCEFTLATAEDLSLSTSTNHVLVGWTEVKSESYVYHPDTTGYVHECGSVYSADVVKPERELYACWAVKRTLKVHFNPSGGTIEGSTTDGDGVDSELTITQDTNEYTGFVINSPIPRSSGHTFIGWGKYSTNNSTYYLIGANIKYEEFKNGEMTLYAIYIAQDADAIQIDDVYIKAGDPCNIVLSYDFGVKNPKYYWWVGQAAMANLRAGNTPTFNTAAASSVSAISGTEMKTTSIKLDPTAYYATCYLVGKPQLTSKEPADVYPLYLLHLSDENPTPVLYQFNIIVYSDTTVDTTVKYTLRYVLNYTGADGNKRYLTEDELKDHIASGRDYTNEQVLESETSAGKFPSTVITVDTSKIGLELNQTVYEYPIVNVFTGRAYNYRDGEIVSGMSIIGWAERAKPNIDEVLLTQGNSVTCVYPTKTTRYIYGQWDYVTTVTLEINDITPAEGASISPIIEELSLYANQPNEYYRVVGSLNAYHDFELPVKGISANGYTFLGWGEEVDNGFGGTKTILHKETYRIILDGLDHKLTAVWVDDTYEVKYHIPEEFRIKNGKDSLEDLIAVSTLVEGESNACKVYTDAEGKYHYITLDGDVYDLSFNTDESYIQVSWVNDSLLGEDAVLEVLPLSIFKGFKNNTLPFGTNNKVSNTYWMNSSKNMYYACGAIDSENVKSTITVKADTVGYLELTYALPPDSWTANITLEYDLVQEDGTSSKVQYNNSTSGTTDIVYVPLPEFTAEVAKPTDVDGIVNTEYTLVGWAVRKQTSDAYYLYDPAMTIYTAGSSVPVEKPATGSTSAPVYLVPVWSATEVITGEVKVKVIGAIIDSTDIFGGKYPDSVTCNNLIRNEEGIIGAYVPLPDLPSEVLHNTDHYRADFWATNAPGSGYAHVLESTTVWVAHTDDEYDFTIYLWCEKAAKVRMDYYVSDILTYTDADQYVYPKLVAKGTEIVRVIRNSPDMGDNKFTGWKLGTSASIYTPGSKFRVNSEDLYEITGYDEDDDPIYALKNPVVYNFNAVGYSSETCSLTRTEKVGDAIKHHTLHIENVQSIAKTLKTSLFTCPIMTQTSDQCITMDIAGVTATYSISFIRISPDHPNDSSEDSRDWSMAKWRRYFTRFADLWQNRYYNYEGTERAGGYLLQYNPREDVADCYPPIRENVYVNGSISTNYQDRNLKCDLSLIIASMKPEGYSGAADPSVTRRVYFVNQLFGSPAYTEKELKQMVQDGTALLSYVIPPINNISNLVITPNIPSQWSMDGADASRWKYGEKAENVANGAQFLKFEDITTAASNAPLDADGKPVAKIVYSVYEFPQYISIIPNPSLHGGDDFTFEFSVNNEYMREHHKVGSYDIIAIGGGAGGNTMFNGKGLTRDSTVATNAGQLVRSSRIPLSEGSTVTKFKCVVGHGGTGGKNVYDGAVEYTGVGLIGNLIGVTNYENETYSPKDGTDSAVYISEDSDAFPESPTCSAKGGETSDDIDGIRVFPKLYEGASDTQRCGYNLAKLKIGGSRTDVSNRFGYGLGGLPCNAAGDHFTINKKSSGCLNGQLYAQTYETVWKAFEDFKAQDTDTNKKKAKEIAEWLSSAVDIKTEYETTGQVRTVAIAGIIDKSDYARGGSGGQASALSTRFKTLGGELPWGNLGEGLSYSSPLTENIINAVNDRYGQVKYLADTTAGTTSSSLTIKSGTTFCLMSMGGDTQYDGGSSTDAIFSAKPSRILDTHAELGEGAHPYTKAFLPFASNVTGYYKDNRYEVGLFGGGGSGHCSTNGANDSLSARAKTLHAGAGNGGSGLIIIRWWPNE